MKKGKRKNKFAMHWQVNKRWLDKYKNGCKDFEIGELVLKWDKANKRKAKHTKFQHLWVYPCLVA